MVWGPAWAAGARSRVRVGFSVHHRRFFPTNPDLANILGDADFYFDILCLYFLRSQFSRFQIPGFQIPGFPDFQVPGTWNQLPGYGRLRPGGGTSRRISAVSGRHSRTTEFRRSKEQGQDRENPISASPVWGMIPSARPQTFVTMSYAFLGPVGFLLMILGQWPLVILI